MQISLNEKHRDDSKGICTQIHSDHRPLRVRVKRRSCQRPCYSSQHEANNNAIALDSCQIQQQPTSSCSSETAPGILTAALSAKQAFWTAVERNAESRRMGKFKKTRCNAALERYKNGCKPHWATARISAPNQHSRLNHKSGRSR